MCIKKSQGEGSFGTAGRRNITQNAPRGYPLALASGRACATNSATSPGDQTNPPTAQPTYFGPGAHSFRSTRLPPNTLLT